MPQSFIKQKQQSIALCVSYIPGARAAHRLADPVACRVALIADVFGSYRQQHAIYAPAHRCRDTCLLKVPGCLAWNS